MQINHSESNDITSITTVTNSKQVIDVIHAAFKRYESDSMPSSALAETSTTIEENIKDGIVILGAYVDDGLVGVVKVTNKSDCYYFSRLAVLPTFQGKGIASSLVAYIEKVAAEKKMDLVQCKVRKSETDNIRLYKKLGYSMTTEEMTTSPSGFMMATVIMEKKIHPY